MSYPVFKQGNYSQQLGTGAGGPSIALDGCAECDVTSVLVWFGKQEDPLKLNQELIAHNGYASNGVGNIHDLLDWNTVSAIYPDVTVAFNHSYPSSPADMNLIDGQLNKQCPVIVGVSFAHDVNATASTHYVTIYAKNQNGSYQMMDPYFGDDTVFDARYAVNGLSVAQCILQAVSYNGIHQAAAPDPASGANYYKGYDLNNLDSMKVAVDILVAVQQGQYVNRADVDAVCTDLGVPAGSNKDVMLAAVNKLKADKSSAEAAAATAEQDANTKQTTIENLNKQIPDLEGQISTLNNQVSDLTQKLNNATSSLNSMTDKSELYTQCEIDLKAARDDLSAATTTYNRRVGQLKKTSLISATRSQLLGQFIIKLWDGLLILLKIRKKAS